MILSPISVPLASIAIEFLLWFGACHQLGTPGLTVGAQVLLNTILQMRSATTEQASTSRQDGVCQGRRVFCVVAICDHCNPRRQFSDHSDRTPVTRQHPDRLTTIPDLYRNVPCGNGPPVGFRTYRVC